VKRSPLKRGRSLARGKAIKRANPRRRKAAHARNFGDEAALVRSLPCLVCGGLAEPAHVTSRGAGGGRFDLVPLCRTHHDEQHSAGVETFAERHGLDLRAEADRVALLHGAPLGVRGLAQRWVWELDVLSAAHGVSASVVAYAKHGINHGTALLQVFTTRRMLEALEPHKGPKGPSTDYERDALLGWVRRRLERNGSIAQAGIGEDLGLDPQACLALCEAAGWPS
jgi:hypothetical protein